MPPRIEPHRARYTIAAPGGGAAGHEDLTVVRAGGGLLITSSLATDYPAPVEAQLQWHLDDGLVTRLLHIHSRDAWGEEADLELTVTGNGLLAHRSAPDGPTQVELGWGPAAELDYLSAAFAAVIMARSFSAGEAERQVDAVEIGIEDLVPAIVARRYTRIDGGEGLRAACHTLATGHVAVVEVNAAGAVLGYEGLLTLEELGEPTK